MSATITTLSIDPGQGFALFDGGTLRCCGTAPTPAARKAVVKDALYLAAHPLVVVMETSNGHAGGSRGRGNRSKKLTPKTCFGMGSGWGRWREALELAGYRADHIVEVESHLWLRAAGIKGDTKAGSIARAKAVHGIKGILSEHAADAINVGDYARGAGLVKSMAETIERAKRGVPEDAPTVCAGQLAFGGDGFELQPAAHQLPDGSYSWPAGAALSEGAEGEARDEA